MPPLWTAGRRIAPFGGLAAFPGRQDILVGWALRKLDEAFQLCVADIYESH